MTTFHFHRLYASVVQNNIRRCLPFCILVILLLPISAECASSSLRFVKTGSPAALPVEVREKCHECKFKIVLIKTSAGARLFTLLEEKRVRVKEGTEAKPQRWKIFSVQPDTGELAEIASGEATVPKEVHVDAEKDRQKLENLLKRVNPQPATANILITGLTSHIYDLTIVRANGDAIWMVVEHHLDESLGFKSRDSLGTEALGTHHLQQIQGITAASFRASDGKRIATVNIPGPFISYALSLESGKEQVVIQNPAWSGTIPFSTAMLSGEKAGVLQPLPLASDSVPSLAELKLMGFEQIAMGGIIFLKNDAQADARFNSVESYEYSPEGKIVRHSEFAEPKIYFPERFSLTKQGNGLCWSYWDVPAVYKDGGGQEHGDLPKYPAFCRQQSGEWTPSSGPGLGPDQYIVPSNRYWVGFEFYRQIQPVEGSSGGKEPPVVKVPTEVKDGEQLFACEFDLSRCWKVQLRPVKGRPEFWITVFKAPWTAR